MTMNGRVSTRCDGCGATDDHPKHHYGPQTFHHDCTPAYLIDTMTSSGDYRRDESGAWVLVASHPLDPEDYPEGTKRFLAIREAALNGTHGDDLLAHIADLHGTGE